MSLIGQGAAIIAAVGSVAAGVFALETRYAPYSVVYELGFSKITELIELVRDLGSTEEGCEQLDHAILNYCSRNTDEYLCQPETVRELKKKAGCS